MSSSLNPSIVEAWKADTSLAVANGPWLTQAPPGTTYPYAVFKARPTKSVPSFGGDREEQYSVEFQAQFADDEPAARAFLDAMDAVFNLTKFPMTAPESCMSSRHERPGEVVFAGVDGKKKIYSARCVYLVRVFIPAS